MRCYFLYQRVWVRRRINNVFNLNMFGDKLASSSGGSRACYKVSGGGKGKGRIFRVL